MADHVCMLETGGDHRASHFHFSNFFDASRFARAGLVQMKYRFADRWRRVTRGQGLMYDCHARADQAKLRAAGRWAIDPIDCSDAVQVARLVEYIVWYFAKDDGQIVRVKPTARARMLTMGR
ncbi:hypothetical protein [Burkholderia seminalis]|uniref:hypothetical protein n=1 Tax=Burkholderia seminalis TaxID=488731 RepID=UPI0015889446|nr:hypothetical protein [Burkholderia seminalis]